MKLCSLVSGGGVAIISSERCFYVPKSVETRKHQLSYAAKGDDSMQQ